MQLRDPGEYAGGKLLIRKNMKKEPVSITDSRPTRSKSRNIQVQIQAADPGFSM